ncbi:MAG TPA: DHH family phosphoesterase [Pseudomonadales bacterium]
MACIDIFNGDADGICALLQLRLAQPVQSRLVTGVKRDIELVASADIQSGDQVTVLDISLDKNRDAVMAALNLGASVLYVDHHFAGDIPKHPQLRARINTAAEVCTSLLVNGDLKGKYAHWAVVGAFGDNLDASAAALARQLTLSAPDMAALRELGVLVNYNGYGPSLEDLHFHPAELYRELYAIGDPLLVVQGQSPTFLRLKNGYDADFDAVRALSPVMQTERLGVYVLPDQPWARRISGVFSNDLTNQAPDRAHAVLSAKPEGGYVVSVRAPLNRREGADQLCRRFPTGGGRAAAAGINHLPDDQQEAFLQAFAENYA